MMFEIHYIIFCLYISIATVHTIYSDLFVDLNCNSTCDVWNTIYDILLENLYCNGRWDVGHTFYIILFVDLYCNSTWDEISCWPDTEPNTTVHLQCADYINGFYVNSKYHSELLGTSRQSSKMISTVLRSVFLSLALPDKKSKKLCLKWVHVVPSGVGRKFKVEGLDLSSELNDLMINWLIDY